MNAYRIAAGIMAGVEFAIRLLGHLLFGGMFLFLVFLAYHDLRAVPWSQVALWTLATMAVLFGLFGAVMGWCWLHNWLDGRARARAYQRHEEVSK